MKQLFTFIMLITTIGSFGQIPGIQWQKSYGGTRGEVATVIRQTTDGGYIVAGNTNSNDTDVSGFNGGAISEGTGNTDIWVIRLDASGELKWSKCLGTSSIDATADVRETADGGFAVAGSGNCPACPFAYNLYRLDKDGKRLWTQYYTGNTKEQAASMQITNDGGFILAGTSYSSAGQITGHHGDATTSDYWIVKTDKNGIIQWQKSYGGTANETAASIAPTKDGGYVIAGHSQSNDGDVTGHHGETGLYPGYFNDIWIVKINSGGDIQWQKSLGGTDEDEAADVQQTTDGGYIVAGSVKSNDGDVTGTHLGGIVSTTDYWLAKLNSSGTLQWQKTFGGGAGDVAHSVQQTKDGGYILAGKTLSSDGDVTGNNGNTDYWIVKTDASGNLQWEKCYGGTSYDEAFCAQQTTDNGFVYAGSTISPVGGDITRRIGTGSDFWIIKTKGVVTGLSELLPQNILVHPNPTTGVYKVTLPPMAGNAEIEVYNSTGVLIYKKTATNATNMVDMGNQSPGIYLLKIVSDNRVIATQKIIKQSK